MTCPNCDTDFAGRYCSNCGQRAVHLRPTLHDLFHEAFHELAHIDGKILRTTSLLLFKPGMLTREFVEGKRARSVSPIRLYLLGSVLFFGIIAVLPAKNLHLSVRNADPQLTQAAATINRDPAILGHALRSAFPKAMFVLMPLFALIVFALYRRTEPLYVPHLYFAVHYHAFAFVALAGFEAATLIPGITKAVVRIAILLWVIGYLPVALRRVYGGTRMVTALKTITIVAVDFVFVMLAMAAIAYVTMRRLA